MLSKSAARKFFVTGTVLCSGAFLLLTLDSFKRIPLQTHEANLTEAVARGKRLWEANNCMGCHTIMGEGAYYAPELTKVYERRGPEFIKQMLKDPAAMYPGQRRMQKYDFTDAEREDLVAFLKWVGEADLNGFPPKPDLISSASAQTATISQSAQARPDAPQPKVFGTVCVACHSIGGQGGSVGPALDDVGARRDRAYLAKWLKNPAAIKADSKMPNLNLSDSDIAELTSYLSQQKGGK